MVMKKILIALALLLTGIASGSACTGISFLAEDGGYVQARTIEVSIRPRACFSPSYNKVKSQTKHVWLLTLL